MRAARAVAGRDAEQLLLIVDDAHDLDILSATLVYQLALARSARMIVTARAQAAPEAIAALWTDGLLDRIDVEPDGGMTGPADVDEFIAELPAAARSVLDYLCVEEPLSVADLTTLAGDGAVTEAGNWGAAETRVRDETVVYTAHPLFAERARAALGDDGARRRRTDWSGCGARQRTSATGCDWRRWRWTATPRNRWVRSSTARSRRCDWATSRWPSGWPARRCSAPVSWRRGCRWPRRVAFQGRGREADAVLAEADPAALSEPELIAWTLLRAANQFFMLGEPERATAFLRTIRNRVTDAGPRVTLDALSATFAMNAGNVGRAVEIAREVLASPSADDQAVAWAGSAAALCAARQGRFDDVEPLAQRALGAEHPGLLRFTIGLGQITALLMAGRLDAARELAQQFTDFAELQQPGRAIGEVLLAHVLLADGEFGRAAALLGPAATALERTGYSWGPLSLMLLATALAQQNDIPGSAKALRRAETRQGTKSALFLPELGVARAWSRAAARDTTGAITAAREAARMAERAGQSAVALRAYHDAVRLGDLRAVDPVRRLAAEIDCAVGNLVVNHAQALAAGDRDALTAVADEFAAVGMRAAAADAAAQAQRL